MFEIKPNKKINTIYIGFGKLRLALKDHCPVKTFAFLNRFVYNFAKLKKKKNRKKKKK